MLSVYSNLFKNLTFDYNLEENSIQKTAVILIKWLYEIMQSVI